MAPGSTESALAATTSPPQAPTPDFLSDIIGFGKGLLRFALLLVLVPLAALTMYWLLGKREQFSETVGWMAAIVSTDVVAVVAIHIAFHYLS